MNAALQDISDPVYPQLAAAFDPNRMAAAVAEALVHRGIKHEILSAKITDVNYDPGMRCTLLFRFKVQQKGGGKTRRQIVTARLLKAGELTPEAPSQEEIRQFERAHPSLLPGPYFLIDNPRMVLCTFPYDPSMPWMVEGLDTTRMKRRFSRLWAPEGWKATKVKVDLMGYTPQMRGAMHYEVKRVHRKTGAEEKIHLIGKTNAFKKTGKLFADSWALWESSGKRFPMPRPAGYLGAPRLTLQERIPGVRLGSLVKAPGFQDRVVQTAEALAFLHRLRFPVNARRRARDELKSLSRWGEVVASIRSDLGSRVNPFLKKVAAEIESRTTAQCAIHADFHHTNVLVHGDDIRVIDFDEMAYGDPAVDVGRFLASLRIPTLRAFGNIHALDAVREQFLEAYLRQTPDDASRIRLFESASLLTSAASAFRIQRPNWDEEVSLLLDEAEGVFARSRRSRPISGASDRIPALSWSERIRWAGDPAYLQAMLDRPVFDAHGADMDGGEVLRRDESRSGFKARFKLVGSRAGNRWKSSVRLAMSKRKGGHTAHRLLEQYYPLVEQHQDALQPPRPLIYLHRLSASVTEACQGEGLHALDTLDQITGAMERVGRALAAWHQASATAAGSGSKPAPRRSSQRSPRSPAHQRAAMIIAKAQSLLPECDRRALCLLHDVRLHEVVLTPESVGLAGVQAISLGDPRHDVAAVVSAWQVEGLVSGQVDHCEAAVTAFVRTYENARGEPLAGLSPFQALALAERTYHLGAKSAAVENVLARAEAQLEEE